MSKGCKFLQNAVLVAVLLAVSISSQTDQLAKADSLLADAKTLVTANTVESIKAAIIKLEGAAAIYKASKAGEKLREADVEYGRALRLLAESEMNAGNDAEALKHLSAAALKLGVYGKSLETAYIYHNLGYVYSRLQKNSDAINYYEKALSAYDGLGDENNEGNVAINLAGALQIVSRISEAKSAADRAMAVYKKAKNEVGQANALLVYADIHSYLNEHSEALAKIKEAASIFKTNPTPGSEMRVARAFSTHYWSVSNYGEALRYSLLALAIAEKDNDELNISACLIDVASTYSNIGQPHKAIDYNTRAYELAKRLKNRQTQAIALSNIGYNNYRLNKFQDAEKFLKMAIAIMRADAMTREEGYATHNLGMVYKKRGQYSQAKANYDRALTLYLRTGDRRPEALLYQSYGELYLTLGDLDRALQNLNKAIVFSREIRYRDIEAGALANMMELWAKRGQRRLAILYGKQAINVYQAIRSETSALDRSSRMSFVQSNEDKYRQLSNLLIDEGRLGEAQQVLDLLKAEEFMDFVRRDASEAVDQAKLALTDTERKALDEYTRLSGQLTALGTRFQTLQDAKTKGGGKLSPAEETEFQNLKTQIEEAGVGIRTFLSKLSNEFSKKVEDQAVITPESIESLRADLRRAGSDVVLVSTYLLPERYRAIVTTGRAMVARTVEYKDQKLTSSDINRKIAEFQRALQNPRVDPRPLGKELYDIFVKPLEADLAGANAKTILWSLDGTLRYIPIAALSPDGKTYLAEKYQNVLVTLARQTNLFAKPASEEWRALGAGVSKPHEGFSALPSVINELNSIVRENGTTGVLDGKKLVDESFDLESLRATLPQTTGDGKAFNVVHLATHFKLGSSDQDSALLLGDGKKLSLFEISKDEELDFKDVELLALSACETGVAAGDGSGREVESLGMLAQKKGAKAVLATLWKVADEGTSMFMSEFYRLKKADPKLSKAEAIRLAQKEMIDGKIRSTGTSGGCRADDFGSGGKSTTFKCDPNAPFSHPYFWSPFVLIGNWR